MAEELLETCPPRLRHWEWGWLKNLCRPRSRVLKDYIPANPEEYPHGISCVAFSPDGRLAASGAQANTGGHWFTRVWDVSSGRIVGTMDPNWYFGSGMVFAPDGRLVMGTSRGLPDLYFWDWKTSNHDPQAHVLPPQERKSVVPRSLSPDGRRLLTFDTGASSTAAKAPLAVIWDVQSGKPIASLASLADASTFITFSPRGERLLSQETIAGTNPTSSPVTKIWAAETGREICTLKGVSHLTNAIFSPNGKLVLATGTSDTSTNLSLWDTDTGELIPRLDLRRSDLGTFSPDGSRLLVRNTPNRKVATLWEIAAGKELVSFIEPNDVILCQAISPDGARVATAGADRVARIWDAATGQQVQVCGEHRKAVQAVAFSPDGKRLLTGSADDSIRLSDLTMPAKPVILRGNLRRIEQAFFSPDSARVLTVSEAPTVKVWEVASGKELLRIQLPGRIESILPFDGRRIYAVYRTNSIGPGSRIARIWDADTGKIIATLEGENLGRFAPDGRHVLDTGHKQAWLSIYQDDPVEKRKYLPKIWNIENGQEVLLDGATNAIQRAVMGPDRGAFSSDSRRLAAPDGSHSVRVWDVLTGHLLVSLEHHTNVYSPVFSPDDRRLEVTTEAGQRMLWDAGTYRQIATHDKPMPGTFSPDGNRLLSPFAGMQSVELRDALTGNQLVQFRGHAHMVPFMAFFPDGKRILTGSLDKTAKVWDAQTGRELLTLPCGEFLSAVAVSPNGRHVLTAVSGGTAAIWTAEDWTETKSEKAPTR